MPTVSKQNIKEDKIRQYNTTAAHNDSKFVTPLWSLTVLTLLSSTYVEAMDQALSPSLQGAPGFHVFGTRLPPSESRARDPSYSNASTCRNINH